MSYTIPFPQLEKNDIPTAGGKGANLAEMTRLGIPVPPGFTISTEACRKFYERKKKMPTGLREEVDRAMRRLEKIQGKRCIAQHPALEPMPVTRGHDPAHRADMAIVLEHDGQDMALQPNVMLPVHFALL